MTKLVVAISSSALFDLTESDRIYREEGVAAYTRYQIEREADPLSPGDAFYLVRKLLGINEKFGQNDRVEVILLSRNTADTGLRVFKSIEHHNLPIYRAAFTGGSPPYKYMRPFGCQLFLSTNRQDVVEALNIGMAAASIVGSPEPFVTNSPEPAATNNLDAGNEQSGRNFFPGAELSSELRFAFDGDAVLFSDEAERVYQLEGHARFMQQEQAAANEPLPGGPFKPFLAALHALQQEFADGTCPIRTALVTARSAPAHERVIKTLRSWDIRLNESLFLGGLAKVEFLRAYQADVFFDDQAEHCILASTVATTGHVPQGITNEETQDAINQDDINKATSKPAKKTHT